LWCVLKKRAEIGTLKTGKRKMIPPKSNIYLETSAINFLADKYSYQDGRETYTYHKMKGTRFYISNVSIWEILLTSNKEKREQLIQYIQNIGHPKLINSPSEMIINYIRKGFPVYEPKYDFHSSLYIASTWEDICENRNKTFVFDAEDLKIRSKMIRSLFKMASKEIEDISEIIPNEKEPTDKEFELICIIPNEKYESFPESSRDKIEGITEGGFSFENKRVQDPNNPVNLLDCKLIKLCV
jgi:hypothetical protein